MFRSALRAATLGEGIKGTDFQFGKGRFLILSYLLRHYNSLSARQTRFLADAILVGGDRQKTLRLLKSFAPGGKTVWYSSSEGLLNDENILKKAHDYANSNSDSRFLSYVKTIPPSNFLHNAAVECEKSAYDFLTTQLDSLVSRVSEKILLIHREECAKQIQRDKHEEATELEASRAQFVQKVADFCREHSRSYVACCSRDE